jgi:hypothetical protein
LEKRLPVAIEAGNLPPVEMSCCAPSFSTRRQAEPQGIQPVSMRIRLVAAEFALPPAFALGRRLEFRDVVIFAFPRLDDDSFEARLAGAGFVPAAGWLRRGGVWLFDSFGRLPVGSGGGLSGLFIVAVVDRRCIPDPALALCFAGIRRRIS